MPGRFASARDFPCTLRAIDPPFATHLRTRIVECRVRRFKFAAPSKVDPE